MTSRRILGLTAISLMGMMLVSAAVFAQKPGQTATQFYMAYRTAFAKAKSIDELLPFMAKENRDQVQATPAGERPKMFEMIKMFDRFTDVKVVKENKTATGATLNVEGLDEDKKKATATVELIQEAGAWKLAKESWSSKASE